MLLVEVVVFKKFDDIDVSKFVMVEIFGFIFMIDNVIIIKIFILSNSWYCFVLIYNIIIVVKIIFIVLLIMDMFVCFMFIELWCLIINIDVKNSVFKIIGFGISFGIS